MPAVDFISNETWVTKNITSLNNDSCFLTHIQIKCAFLCNLCEHNLPLWPIDTYLIVNNILDITLKNVQHFSFILILDKYIHNYFIFETARRFQ